MQTVIVQIGNSDNKLTQEKWSKFFIETEEYVKQYAAMVHFSGHSLPDSMYQNAAFIFEINLEEKLMLRSKLEKLCAWNNQDSIAWTEGSTTFIK